MKYRIVHETTYQYSEPASLSQNELFLHPRETTTQRLIESELVIVPQPQYLHRRSDYFGNIAHVFMVQQPHNHLAISATCLVTVERPTTPVPARPSCTSRPSRRNEAATMPAVRRSSNASSGWA